MGTFSEYQHTLTLALSFPPLFIVFYPFFLSLLSFSLFPVTCDFNFCIFFLENSFLSFSNFLSFFYLGHIFLLLTLFFSTSNSFHTHFWVYSYNRHYEVIFLHQAPSTQAFGLSRGANVIRRTGTDVTLQKSMTWSRASHDKLIKNIVSQTKIMY